MVMGSMKDEDVKSSEYNVHWPVLTFLSLIWIGVYICIIIDIRSSRLVM